jgi:hypothetical protein
MNDSIRVGDRFNDDNVTFRVIRPVFKKGKPTGMWRVALAVPSDFAHKTKIIQMDEATISAYKNNYTGTRMSRGMKVVGTNQGERRSKRTPFKFHWNISPHPQLSN